MIRLMILLVGSHNTTMIRLLMILLVTASCGSPKAALPDTHKEPPLVERHTFTMFLGKNNTKQAIDTLKTLVEGGAKDIYIRLVFLGDGWHQKKQTFTQWQHVIESQAGIKSERIQMEPTGYPMGKALNQPSFGAHKEVQIGVDTYILNPEPCLESEGEIALGCTQKINLAMMVKEPKDLLKGKEKEASPASISGSAVRTLRERTTESAVSQDAALPSIGSN